jgi:hypothetical protein
MHRSSNNLLSSRQPPSNVDNYKTLNELVIKPPSTRLSRQSPTMQHDQLDDDDYNNRTIRKLITDQPLNPSRSRSPSNISLKSMVIDGQWKYRQHADDKLRLKSLGIENLVSICHDILNKTFESTNRKQERRRKSPSINEVFPIVKLDEYKRLTNTDRSYLRRTQIFELMTIVYEATLTSASISQLVRIWREASEHNLHRRRLKIIESQPLISYNDAFRNLIRTPDNQLLQIGLHASLINPHNRVDLRRLGEKLGIKKSQFDMESIRNSTEAFRYLIKILREQRLKEMREQKHIDTKKLPYKPKKKRGLYANLSGTKFRLSKSRTEV